MSAMNHSRLPMIQSPALDFREWHAEQSDCQLPSSSQNNARSGHHGRTTARTHPAKRILGAEQSRATIPTGGISALAERATRPIDFAGMGGASAAGDELAATGLGAIHQGHDSSGQTSVILTP